ncbi:MAG: cupin domain-containing protein [Woeseiaceae bacterium]
MKNANVAEVVVPCQSLDETLAFFVEDLNFRIEMIYPADAPQVAVISAYGVRLRLDSTTEGEPGSIRIHADEYPSDIRTRTAPNGTKIEFVVDEQKVILPTLVSSLVVQSGSDRSAFGKGRAGMQYRDLIPGRYGGRFIASHIQIPSGGPVPDYVHHHHVQFQLIFCVNGWVRVVYEDQGEPMLMEAGDCFLQPPHIRHRVLECSDQMEVVEIGCPAEHETCVDHEMTLPTPNLKPDRLFGGQRFVFHRAAKTEWQAGKVAGIEYQDTGIDNATNGIASLLVWRLNQPVAEVSLDHDGDLRFLFVLKGTANLDNGGSRRWQLQHGDSCAIPSSSNCRLSDVSADFKTLELSVPSQ